MGQQTSRSALYRISSATREAPGFETALTFTNLLGVSLGTLFNIDAQSQPTEVRLDLSKLTQTLAQLSDKDARIAQRLIDATMELTPPDN